METQQLRQNLLQPQPQRNRLYDEQPTYRQRRFTIALPNHRNSNDIQNQLNSMRASSFERLIRTQIIEDWNEQDIVERMSLLGDMNNLQVDAIENVPQPVAPTRRRQYNRNNYTESMMFSNEVKKQLNNRIFKLSKKIQKCLYIFNLIFNTVFRTSLIVILILEFLQKKQNTIPTAVLLGLEGVCIMLYIIAMTKILYTKSSEISVFFQKQFYAKPYAQIFMERVLRKHFTFYKFRTNFINFINPCSPFNWNIKISLIRQEIFKRMEMVIVGIPLIICYAFDIPWFNLEMEQDNSESVKTGIVMSIVLICELFRLTVHYLVIYIFS